MNKKDKDKDDLVFVYIFFFLLNVFMAFANSQFTNNNSSICKNISYILVSISLIVLINGLVNIKKSVPAVGILYLITINMFISSLLFLVGANAQFISYQYTRTGSNISFLHYSLMFYSLFMIIPSIIIRFILNNKSIWSFCYGPLKTLKDIVKSLIIFIIGIAILVISMYLVGSSLFNDSNLLIGINSPLFLLMISVLLGLTTVFVLSALRVGKVGNKK